MKLLSFGADEDAGEDDETVIFKKKPIVRPDCAFFFYQTLMDALFFFSFLFFRTINI